LGLGYLLRAELLWFFIRFLTGVFSEPALDFLLISMVSIFEMSFLGFGLMLYIPMALLVV
jgi:hypothetical protein